nr:MAG TPA: Cytosine specific methyltransferase [Caudoviricetes sp.]
MPHGRAARHPCPRRAPGGGGAVRYLSTFSGIEAATVAWGPLGWEPLAFAEVDAFPSAVLAERFPGVDNVGDVRLADWSRFRGACDLVVGGSPCQSFSVAGKREGLDGASGLMWEYVRCVRDVRPGAFLWENVPGALSSSKGADFRCLLAAMDELGYGMAWRVLDAQFFGVAQRRRRVFLVGRLGDPGRACEVLFEPESLRWDTPSSRKKRRELAARAGRGAEAAGGALNPHDPQSKRVFDPEGPAPTLSSGTGEGMNIQPSVMVSSGFRYHQGPGAGGIGCEPEQSPTLITDYHNPAVPCMTDTQTHSSVSGDTCGALSATMGEQAQGVMQGYVVRRLTPRECERLQGFPDDWTRIPWRGRPPEECPDAPRYKAVGNSMAVPVMRWIGERMGGVTGDA